MEFRGPQPTKKTVAAIAVVACVGVTFHGIDDFKVTIPLKPVFDAPAYSGGTLIARGAYHSAPPNGKIDVTAVRRFLGGAAIADS